jgi:endoglucanase
MVDEHGETVQLKGMSLFWHNWMGQYYNAATVNWLAQDWNASVVRAAIGVEEEGGYLEDEADAKEKARAVINAAIDQGIYVVVDWHTHSVDNNRNEAKAFFEEMAQEYGDKPNIIYEVFNEPVDQSWSDIKSYAEEIIGAIRAIDPDNIILVGCRTWSQEILEPAADPITNYTNIAYTTHFYAGTHQQSLRDRVGAALDQGIHVFISEWGTSQADGGSDGVVHTDESNAWLDFLDQHNLSWCNWSIADKVEASAALQPDASGDGGWSESDLSESGLFVRAKLIGQRDKK